MDEEDHLSFFAEWYDPQAAQLKPYILHFYGDQTLELVGRFPLLLWSHVIRTDSSRSFCLQIERNTRRTFLKRIRIPTVSLKDLFIGASISMCVQNNPRTTTSYSYLIILSSYSRQLTILEAANEYTRNQLSRQASKASIILLPKGYRSMGKIVSVIERSASADSCHIVNALMLQLESSHLPILTSQFTPQLSAAHLQQQHVTKDVSLALEVKWATPNALEDVRAKLEAARLSEFILVSDSGLGNLLAVSPVATTAVLDNCSLCLLRPRMLHEHRVGELLDAILAAGFEISALKLLHLTTRDADEFFRVYKGISRQYHEVIKCMTSAPLIALEVRGDDVVRSFREFCGPHDVEIARALRPSSLRARFGRSNLHNAVHCTDCPEDGVLETQFIFASLC
jgi:nucleoside-diphosphate kinase